jgi:hypothetical protein
MAITFSCTCGKAYRRRDEYAGSPMVCKACGAEIRVPSPEDDEEPGSGPTAAATIAPGPAGGRSPADPADPPRTYSPARSVVRGGPYVYKMHQMPPSLSIAEGTAITNQAALHLETIVNKYAEAGWEFYRVDQVGYRIEPGCLMAFLGVKTRYVTYYVVTFRMPVEEAIRRMGT